MRERRCGRAAQGSRGDAHTQQQQQQHAARAHQPRRRSPPRRAHPSSVRTPPRQRAPRRSPGGHRQRSRPSQYPPPQLWQQQQQHASHTARAHCSGSRGGGALSQGREALLSKAPVPLRRCTRVPRLRRCYRLRDVRPGFVQQPEVELGACVCARATPCAVESRGRQDAAATAWHTPARTETPPPPPAPGTRLPLRGPFRRHRRRPPGTPSRRCRAPWGTRPPRPRSAQQTPPSRP